MRYTTRSCFQPASSPARSPAQTPLMLKTAGNPGGLPIDAFDKIRASVLADRSQFFKDLAGGPFYGFNRPGAKVSQGLIVALP